jgi:regulator of RNase E activity RraA
MHRSGGLAGAALSVKAPPGDNLMVHKAIALAEAGDIIAADAGGDLTNAITGEMMLMQMIKRGVAGLIINGAIRDAGYIRSQDFSVFAAGVTHRGRYKKGGAKINVPIAIDGMVIEPGDLVIGDEDGLFSVPFDQTDAVFKAASAHPG